MNNQNRTSEHFLLCGSIYTLTNKKFYVIIFLRIYFVRSKNVNSLLTASTSLLVNGTEAFPEILNCIEKAQKSIEINMFIWRGDNIGKTVAQAVLNAAEREVKVFISVDRYGLVLEKCEECMPARDSYELALLKLVLENNKPVLGICRGVQVLNVLYGGDLYQDIPTQLGCDVVHRAAVMGEAAMHLMEVYDNTPLARITGERTIEVNSFHHQAIKNLGEGLLPMAKSPDGVIEGAYVYGKRFAIAVQWHPELMFRTDKNAMALFEALVDAAKN